MYNINNFFYVYAHVKIYNYNLLYCTILQVSHKFLNFSDIVLLWIKMSSFIYLRNNFVRYSAQPTDR